VRIISNTEFIKRIDKSLNNYNSNRNSMGCSEANYDIYYMIGRALNNKETKCLTKNEIRLLIKLAKYASDAFY
jgi:hypothetical protein